LHLPHHLAAVGSWAVYTTHRRVSYLSPVVVKQPEFVIEPTPTPPLPAETLPVTGPHQMPPYLLLHPVFDKTKASTGVANGKVIHLAAHNRVDDLHHPGYRLGVKARKMSLSFRSNAVRCLSLGG